MKSEKLKILFIPNNEGFCNYYRMSYPAWAINDAGIGEARVMSGYTEDEFADNFFWADIIHFQAHSPANEHILFMIKEYIEKHNKPKVIGMDMDDDMFNIDIYNCGAYREWGLSEVKSLKDKYLWKDGEGGFNIKENKDRVNRLAEIITMCDFITVSNSNIASTIRDQLKLNDNVFTIPNFIYPKFMKENEREDTEEKRTIIGFMGGDSHYIDLVRVMPVLERVKNKYKDKVHFRFMGPRFDEMFDRVDGEIIPWIKPRLFFDRFSAKRFDIGIIPLEETWFNKCKSNIKWLEYSFYNIVSIVEKRTPYKEHAINGKNILFYESQEQMYNHLCKCIDSKDYRDKISSKAKKDVLNNWDINKYIKQRVDFYKKAFDLKKLLLKR